MTIYNFGSINMDHVYRMPHLPAAGETLQAKSYECGLGGKGANQSVAAARFGATCYHIGAIGPEGDVILAQLAAYGVDVRYVSKINTPTGHAIIMVEEGAENSIVLFAGANHAQDAKMPLKALEQAAPHDTLLMQNETSLQRQVAKQAAERGLRVVYSAAPFDVGALKDVLPYMSMLAVNELEAAQLAADMGALPPVSCVITKGKQGAEWVRPGHEPLFMPAFSVTAVDTTGAGDTFIGTLVAALDKGMAEAQAMRHAAAGSAIQVTRRGAASAIADFDEIAAFLKDRGL